MRKSNLVTISLPATINKQARAVAKRRGMTHSELFRDALRRYLEELSLEEAIKEADLELASGKAKVLPVGGLVKLMRR